MNSKKTTLHENLPIVEVADKVLLDMLFADSQASRHLATRLSNTVAVVFPVQSDVLLARLRKLGHTPKVVEV